MNPAAPAPGPGPGPSAVWRRHAPALGLDDLAAAQPHWRLQYEQLSAGRLTAALHQVQLPGLRLCLETVDRAVHQHGQLGAQGIGFAMAAAACGGETRFHGQRVGADSLMVGRGDALDLATPEGSQVLGIVVDRALLAAEWPRLYLKPWSAWLDQPLVVPARPGLAAPLQALQRGVMAAVAADPARLQQPAVVAQWRDALLMEWLAAIPARVDSDRPKTLAARRQVVDRARERVLAGPDQVPTLLGLCQAIGVGPRKLGYCFQDVLGLHPSRYLKALRLNGARRALARGDDGAATVHDIAARWGFWHMGAFSADYKRLFGELPSATRRGRAVGG